MDPTADKYYDYYDLLYAGKDYSGDVETVLEIYKQYGRQALKRVLDVGCGTGNHSVELARMGHQVVGVDIDPQMIERARSKVDRISEGELFFWLGDIAELEDSGFELAVSMFNVVNYIHSLNELLRFFAAINQRLVQGGIYVFDSWNGLAAQLDPPRHEFRHIQADGMVIELELKPFLTPMEEKVVLNNVFSVVMPNTSERDEFEYAYTMRLWTPRVLREVIEVSGFNVLHISKQGVWEQEATEQDWKIMLACRKC